MVIEIHRSYFKEGTNGTLFINGKFFCFCIELPWLNNKRNISCIPEGEYELIHRFSPKFKHHLMVTNVNNRSFILFHVGNNAKLDLKGCISPVSYLSGIGKGTQSRIALEKLVSKVLQAKDRNEKVVLTIKS